MKIFRGLENLNSVIDQHEFEWRREQGEEPVQRERVSLEEAVRRRLTAQPSEGSGKLSADRFLSKKSETVKKEAPEPQAIEIIKSKDEHHSWLYNEVMKAIKDASKDGKTKVVAVFVPVVQNGKEFEELPVDDTVTLSPVAEEFTKIETETLSPEPEPEPESETGTFELLPAEPVENDAVLAQAFKEMEEKLDEKILEKNRQEEQEEQEQEEQEQEEQEQEEKLDAEPEIEEIVESEPESEPEVIEPEPEVAPEILPSESESEQEEPEEIKEVEEIEEIDEVVDSGEPLTFEEEEIKEPETEKISLPELLDDDEVFDDSVFDETLTEVQKPDEDEVDETGETIVLEEAEDEKSDGNGEVEIIPEQGKQEA